MTRNARLARGRRNQCPTGRDCDEEHEAGEGSKEPVHRLTEEAPRARSGVLGSPSGMDEPTEADARAARL